MFRACRYDPATRLFNQFPTDEIPQQLLDPDAVLWVDFCQEPPEFASPILLETFHFHPLAVDDALVETHIPKLDDWGDYLYLVFNPMELDSNSPMELITRELDVFITPNCLVTFHDDALPFLERTWEAHLQIPRVNATAPGHLLYRVVDEMVNDTFTLLEDLDDRLDEIEEEVLLKSKPNTLEGIFTMKRVVIGIRRVLVPEREVLNKLSREDFGALRSVEKLFFRDIYDHMLRMVDLNEGLRDLITGAMETHLSVTNNRMNQVMKILTIITTLFMPISFITGFFGMNFFGASGSLDNWTNSTIFQAAMAILMLTPLSMLWYMRQHRWM